jgi:uncharacterized protein (TIGR03435 family)
MRSFRSSLLLVPFAVSILSAQVIKSDGPKPQFEVATIRPNTSGQQGASLGGRPGGRLLGTNQTVRNLIRNAFNLQPYQIVGGPGWIDADRFDIVAKAADADVDAKGQVAPPGMMLRLQSLLEERFSLKTHRETRELPAYALVRVSPESLGPRLKVHTGDCARPPGTAPSAAAPAVKCGTNVNASPTGAKVTGAGITMETFARNLSGAAGRYVVDKTGLAGPHDLELEFTPDQSADTTGPSLFTAMQEQLGLKLDSERAPIEVLVIDRVERPTPD